MHRRAFLADLAAGASSGLLPRLTAESAVERTVKPVRIQVDPQHTLTSIPTDFLGLGYEISSVAIPGLLSAANHSYVQLVRTLSTEGVIRIGGNTSDDASFSVAGANVSAPKGTIVNRAALRDLSAFLQATNWKLIWGLNLGSTDEKQAAEEAEAVSAACQGRLLAFEIGNEPDLFGRGTKHRESSYSYDAFLREYRRYKAAIRSRLPEAAFAGPDAATATDWVSRFANDEGSDVRLLTHHYYRECAGPASTLDKLLRPDPKLGPILQQLSYAAAKSNLPYRICETNSFCGGGKPGVSDTFGAALWVLDFLFVLAAAKCSGVNLETGVNQLGFISSYSPIVEGERGSYIAQAPYYGMLAFAHASKGDLVLSRCDAGDLNVSVYAVLDGRRHLRTTVINKEAERDAAVQISAGTEPSKARVLRLTAAGLQTKTGITFGGEGVDKSGKWNPSTIEFQQVRNGRFDVRVPAGTAAVVELS